jgi:uncharacterized iron-regulated membrane protein
VALIPLSVTGSVLVWHDQIDREHYAERYAVTGARVAEPIETYADVAQAAFATRAISPRYGYHRKPETRSWPWGEWS